MSRQLLFLILAMFVVAGCTGHHYTTESPDSVVFFLYQPDAGNVQFASSVDKYMLHDTRKNRLGFWEISRLLTTGSLYFYVVDGSVYIPDCPYKENDDFGSTNCLYLQEVSQLL